MGILTANQQNIRTVSLLFGYRICSFCAYVLPLKPCSIASALGVPYEDLSQNEIEQVNQYIAFLKISANR